MKAAAGADPLREMLRKPEYRKALVFCALIGVPVSLVAFWFLAGLHEVQHLLWESWPHHLGWSRPPWWWPFPPLAVAGVAVGSVVKWLPGRGGHVPAGGLHPGGTTVRALPGIVLAAVAGLPLGVVLGPEAPLIALGGGLALLFRDLARAPASQQGDTLLTAAGSGAAIAVIFGNPLVAAVLLMEVAGVGGPQLFAVMLPALLCCGIGSVVFTGFGRWTGLKTGSLSIGLPAPPVLDTGDVVWSILAGVVIGVVVHRITAGGVWVAVRAAARPLPVAVVCALATAGCAALYTAATGRTPADVVLSGQSALGELAGDPHAWSVGALFAVLAFKGIGYTLCLGSLRGGPIFPAVFLGGAAGVLMAPLPGFGLVPAMAAGMGAAVVAALRLPISGTVLVVLLLGHSGSIPVIVLAAVTAFMTAELLPLPRHPVPSG
ncbi:chloride channel protein [Actinacidiphila yeochonensis]|uniref:chloride channel protein n=1 Tax=Actinacidiphila yeochonensis TaxID=89050 RepID=UPI000AF8FDEE|nr:chloride channel protein [Actinacidiphila yeochonensis]